MRLYYTIILLKISMVFTLIFSVNSLLAQNNNEELDKKAFRTVENSPTATAADKELSTKVKSKHPELENKINILLKELRPLLAIDANQLWFRENLEKSIAEKSEHICPNIGLIELIYSSKPFVPSTEMDSQQLLYVVDFLSLSINALMGR